MKYLQNFYLILFANNLLIDLVNYFILEKAHQKIQFYYQGKRFVFINLYYFFLFFLCFIVYEQIQIKEVQNTFTYILFFMNLNLTTEVLYKIFVNIPVNPYLIKIVKNLKKKVDKHKIRCYYIFVNKINLLTEG